MHFTQFSPKRIPIKAFRCSCCWWLPIIFFLWRYVLSSAKTHTERPNSGTSYDSYSTLIYWKLHLAWNILAFSLFSLSPWFRSLSCPFSPFPSFVSRIPHAFAPQSSIAFNLLLPRFLSLSFGLSVYFSLDLLFTTHLVASFTMVFVGRSIGERYQLVWNRFRNVFARTRSRICQYKIFNVITKQKKSKRSFGKIKPRTNATNSTAARELNQCETHTERCQTVNISNHYIAIILNHRITIVRCILKRESRQTEKNVDESRLSVLWNVFNGFANH